MADPEVKAAILAERPEPTTPSLREPAPRPARRGVPVGAAPRPGARPEHQPRGASRRVRRDPEELLYEWTIADDGEPLVHYFLGGYPGYLDASLELMAHPLSVLGLGDGGADVDIICDCGYPSFVLSYWARDRARGTLPLETRDPRSSPASRPALRHGRPRPRGRGKKADLNVLDADAIDPHPVEIVYDLPAGAKRIPARRRVRHHHRRRRSRAARGVDTGAWPGRVVRSPRRPPRAAGAAPPSAPRLAPRPPRARAATRPPPHPRRAPRAARPNLVVGAARLMTAANPRSHVTRYHPSARSRALTRKPFPTGTRASAARSRRRVYPARCHRAAYVALRASQLSSRPPPHHLRRWRSAPSLSSPRRERLRRDAPAPTTDLSLDEIELGNPDTFLRDDVDGIFALLRRERPVGFDPEFTPEGLPPGPGFWSLVRHRDMFGVSRDYDSFTSVPAVGIFDYPVKTSIINMDPPIHTKYRLIVNRGFTPRMIARLKENISEQAARSSRRSPRTVRVTSSPTSRRGCPAR